jgi:hypothetical protein
MKPIWITGPTRYDQSLNYGGGWRKVERVRYEFVGMDDAGKFRRWHLIYAVDKRKFSLSSLYVPEFENRKLERLSEIYKPACVLYKELPSGSVCTKLQAMLTKEDWAEITALSILEGHE